MKKRIRISESQMKSIIAESARKVLREASIGRGTSTDRDSSYSGDEYGGITTYSYQTSENPYDSDGVLMLANRFEKRLGGIYKVEAHLNNDYVHYGKESGLLDSNIEFIVSAYELKQYSNFEHVLYVMNTAKKLFQNNIYNISFDDNNNVVIIVRSIILLNKEPRRGMLPKNSKNPSITGSNFDHPRYWNEYDN